MTRTFITTLLLAALAPLCSAQSDSLGVLDRARSDARLRQGVLSLAWDNPAAKQLERDYAMSTVAALWQLRHEDDALRTQVGNHESTWAFDAASYMKHRTSTLWGHAAYHNGRTSGSAWNETSDLEVVYPYVLADSVTAAHMNVERYDFGGGYADGRGRWLYGAALRYTAGLYYRSSDPRPRNVTGRLHLQAGGGYALSDDYAIAAALAFTKYKQTCEVTFYSEMGNDKLFHLTGLSNDYGRFAGTAYNTYYKGHRYSAMLGVNPLRQRGLSATLEASRMTIDNVLTSLNKLPMARIAHNELRAEAAWLAGDWAVKADIQASRRTGRENIFGDASAGVYPQIGALDIYHENRFAAAVSGVWERTMGRGSLGLAPAVSYHHLNEIYADPQCRRLVNDLETALTARGTLRYGRTLHALTLGAAHTAVIDHDLMINGTRDELAGLQRVIEHDHGYLTHGHTRLSAAYSATIALNARHALRAGVDYRHGFYTAGNHTHNLTASLAFIF